MKHVNLAIAVAAAMSFPVLVAIVASAATAESRMKSATRAAAVRAVDELLDCALLAEEGATCEPEEGRMRGHGYARQ